MFLSFFRYIINFTNFFQKYNQTRPRPNIRCRFVVENALAPLLVIISLMLPPHNLLYPLTYYDLWDSFFVQNNSNVAMVTKRLSEYEICIAKRRLSLFLYLMLPTWSYTKIIIRTNWFIYLGPRVYKCTHPYTNMIYDGFKQNMCFFARLICQEKKFINL